MEVVEKKYVTSVMHDYATVKGLMFCIVKSDSMEGVELALDYFDALLIIYDCRNTEHYVKLKSDFVNDVISPLLDLKRKEFLLNELDWIESKRIQQTQIYQEI